MLEKNMNCNCIYVLFSKKGCSMKQKLFSPLPYHMMLAAAFLSSCLQAVETEQQDVQIHLSMLELQEIFSNPNRPYVYVGSEVSEIASIINEISALDDDADSLIHGLKGHIEKGFAIGNYDAVAQALEQAWLLLAK